MFKFDRLLETMWNKFTQDPAKMLIITGTSGWALSSAAQIFALLFNDKISAKEKTFLIPQEMFDAIVNIGSFYLVTQGIKKGTAKLVSTGKLTTKSIRTYLENSPFKDSVGKANFDIERDLKGIISFNEHMDSYTSFMKLATVVGSTAGSVLSCNIITPILRNKLAAFSHNSIIKSANEGTNKVFTKEELENKDSHLLHVKNPLHKHSGSHGLKI